MNMFDDSGVRYAMVQNPGTPADVMLKLATDISVYIRRDVASNPRTPIDEGRTHDKP